jgi:hypothetical protein
MRSETQSFKFPEIVEKLPGLFVVDPSTGCAVTRQAPQPPERRSEDTSGISVAMALSIVCHGSSSWDVLREKPDAVHYQLESVPDRNNY